MSSRKPQTLQQQSAANGKKQGIFAKLDEQKEAHKELLKKYKAADPEEKKKMTRSLAFSASPWLLR